MRREVDCITCTPPVHILPCPHAMVKGHKKCIGCVRCKVEKIMYGVEEEKKDD